MNTRELIIEKALCVFADKGYEGASLAIIADEVGIKKPSLYNHFKGKKELFISVFDRVIVDYTFFMKKSFSNAPGESAKEILRNLLFEICDYYVQNQHESAMWKRALLFPNAEWEREIKNSFYESEEQTNAMIYDAFERGIAAGEVRKTDVPELVQAYCCLLDGLFLQMSYYPKETFEERRINVWNIFWNGIAATDK